MPIVTDIRAQVAEWLSLLRDAPVTVIVTVVLTAPVIWGVLSWSYSTRIDQKEDRIKRLEGEISDYKSKLHVSSAFEAAKRIEDLQRQLAALQTAPSQEVYKDFHSIVKTHPELGKPLDKMQPTNIAMQAWYEHAIVLWVNSLSRFFVLASPDKLQEFPDPVWSSDPKWTQEEALIKMFGKPPEGLRPPTGGVALHWEDYGWKSTLGWRKEECFFENSTIRYQQFEYGTIIGPFLKLQNNLAGQEIVLIGSKWFPIASVQKGADCSVHR